MKNEEVIKKLALEAYPENISYSTVVEKMVDYNGNKRFIFMQGARAMAEWKDGQSKEKEQQLIDKACEWIENNYINECGYIACGNANISFQQGTAIEKFKKAMLEE